MNWELYYNYDKDNYDVFKGTTEIGLHGDVDAISKISVSNNKTFLILKHKFPFLGCIALLLLHL